MNCGKPEQSASNLTLHKPPSLPRLPLLCPVVPNRRSVADGTEAVSSPGSLGSARSPACGTRVPTATSCAQRRCPRPSTAPLRAAHGRTWPKLLSCSCSELTGTEPNKRPLGTRLSSAPLPGSCAEPRRLLLRTEPPTRERPSLRPSSQLQLGAPLTGEGWGAWGR